MAAGWLLYRSAGAYRRGLAGGRGMSTQPAVLVTTGPYAWTRNPMYLGHLVFIAGLTWAGRSPLGILLLFERWLRFSARVRTDERRLGELFGADYDEYRTRVPRWLPRFELRLSRDAAGADA